MLDVFSLCKGGSHFVSVSVLGFIQLLFYLFVSIFCWESQYGIDLNFRNADDDDSRGASSPSPFQKHPP